jgi:ParB family chromosome partitioning protein
MARRRRLDTPDTAELARMAEDFAAKQPDAAALPIARVVADAAAQTARAAIEERIEAAANQADATRWREATAAGLVVEAVPLGAIDAEHLLRDRSTLDAEEMAALMASIRVHGLRLPVEVLPLAGEGDEARYGLVSGWRRLKAMRALLAETGEARFATIKALVRTPQDAAAAYVAMVEENEIRADLSHYERGRVCVLAAGQGAFASTDAAVAALFASASKAKRSKIRSFAMIHEEIGDALIFGPALNERTGLRLASALRGGAGPRLRHLLAHTARDSAADELAVIEEWLAEHEHTQAGGSATTEKPVPGSRRERLAGDVVQLANGLVLERVAGPGYVGLRLRGRAADTDLLETVAREVTRLLGPA